MQIDALGKFLRKYDAASDAAATIIAGRSRLIRELNEAPKSKTWNDAYPKFQIIVREPGKTYAVLPTAEAFAERAEQGPKKLDMSVDSNFKELERVYGMTDLSTAPPDMIGLITAQHEFIVEWYGSMSDTTKRMKRSMKSLIEKMKKLRPGK